jgi:hypothetical protein
MPNGMNVSSQLSSSKGERSETANVALAAALAKSRNHDGIAELVEQLAGSNRAVRSDCIKVLYEIGARDATLIRPYLDRFAALLSDRDNRMAWGAMTALDAIAKVDAKAVARRLPEVANAARTGSVITRDHAIGIFVRLAAAPKLRERCLKLLTEQLGSAPFNQVGMYAEMVAPLLQERDGVRLADALRSRIRDLPKESQKRRVEKVLRRVAGAGTHASFSRGRR